MSKSFSPDQLTEDTAASGDNPAEAPLLPQDYLSSKSSRKRAQREDSAFKDWSDEALLRYLQQYSEEDDIFPILHKRHVQWIQAQARRFVNEADAWDLTQEFFIYLWEKIPSLTFPYCIRSLASRVIRNKALNFLRKQNRCQLFTPIEFDGIESGQYVYDHFTKTELWDHLAAILSAREYRLIAMRFRLELSYTQIAEREGVPIGTSKRLLHEVKNKLRESKDLS
ncbi:MAG: sigma-70 family RNA polymerase sigma factor [Opitutales bacterium]